jgi:hypothetical protein
MGVRVVLVTLSHAPDAIDLAVLPGACFWVALSVFVVIMSIFDVYVQEVVVKFQVDLAQTQGHVQT